MIPARIALCGPRSAEWEGGHLEIVCPDPKDAARLIGKLVAAFNMHDELLEQLRKNNAAMTALREALEDLQNGKE